MANNNSEGNKDFVLLSTNLNAYKSADDNRTLSNNDRNFLFTKVDSSNSRFDLISSSNQHHPHTNTPNDLAQFDSQSYRLQQQSINAENFRPTSSSYHQVANEQIIHDETNKLPLHNNYASNINNNRNCYDWTQNQQQLNYAQYPAIVPNQSVNTYPGYSNQSKCMNSNNYFYSTSQPYQTSVYENAAASRLNNTNLTHSYNNYNTNCFGYSNVDCPTKSDSLANYQTNFSASQHNAFPLKTSPSIAASGFQYSASNSFDCHLNCNINHPSSSQFSDLSSQMAYGNQRAVNTSIPSSSFHFTDNVAEASQIAANTNYQPLDQCRTLSFNNVSNKNSNNNSKSTMPNDSLQSPSTSSSSSGSYSSNGFANCQESLSSDIDDDDDNDDDNDDDDDENSEDDNQNAKTNKNKQNRMNAPWTQPG